MAQISASQTAELSVRNNYPELNRNMKKISTLIKRRERLLFLHVVIQTNYHCTSENFSLKTNIRNKLRVFGKPTLLTNRATASTSKGFG